MSQFDNLNANSQMQIRKAASPVFNAFADLIADHYPDSNEDY